MQNSQYNKNEFNYVKYFSKDSTLLITVQYTLRRTLEEQTARFTRPGTV
jgi:hypothetical protein